MFYRFILKWSARDVFDDDVLDASLYIVFYIILPIVMNLTSLKISESNNFDRIYCYIGIIINACGCGYDLINRRDTMHRTIKNTKLWIMGASVVAVILDSILGIIFVTVGSSTKIIDAWLSIYFVSVSLALLDIVPLLLHHSDFKMQMSVETVEECLDLENAKRSKAGE